MKRVLFPQTEPFPPQVQEFTRIRQEVSLWSTSDIFCFYDVFLGKRLSLQLRLVAKKSSSEFLSEVIFSTPEKENRLQDFRWCVSRKGSKKKLGFFNSKIVFLSCLNILVFFLIPIYFICYFSTVYSDTLDVSRRWVEKADSKILK